MKRFCFALIAICCSLSLTFGQETNSVAPDVATDVASSENTDSAGSSKESTDSDSSKNEENDTRKGSISSSYSYHSAGDQLIRIALGVDFPLFNIDAYGKFITDTGLHVGGTGMIGYSYYVTPEVSLGGEVSVSFMTTRGSNTLFAVPIVFRTGYQFVVGSFEFPLDLGIGLAIQTCANKNYYGLILRPEAGFYYRYSPDWSFGGNLIWNFIPQWYDNKDYTRYGNVLEVSAGIRYHF